MEASEETAQQRSERARLAVKRGQQYTFDKAGDLYAPPHYDLLKGKELKEKPSQRRHL